MKIENLATVAQYAAACGVAPKTIYEWAKTGRVTLVQVGKIKLVIKPENK